MMALRQNIEPVFYRFSCGDILLGTHHHLSKVILKRKKLTGESPIEKGYYNNKNRRLELKKLCHDSGESGGTSFVFGLEQLRKI